MPSRTQIPQFNESHQPARIPYVSLQIVRDDGRQLLGRPNSAYMLRQVLDNNDDLSDLVVTFANIGKEHPATLEFVRDCAERWSVPIVWLEFRDIEAGFEFVDYASASRQGKPFEALIPKRKDLPNPVTRICTIDLKIRIIHKYLRNLGFSTEEMPVDMMTGIRADGAGRVEKIRNRKSTSESKWATMVMPLADGELASKTLLTSGLPSHST